MSDNVLQSLAESPAVKQAMLAQIGSQRAELQAKLSELDSVEASLSGAQASKRRGRPAKAAAKASKSKSGAPKGRPKGKRNGPSQRHRVLELVAKNKNGLKADAICEKLGIDKQVLQTLLSVMKNKNNELKTSGKSRKQKGEGFVYSITKAGSDALKGAVKKAEAKAEAKVEARPATK